MQRISYFGAAAILLATAGCSASPPDLSAHDAWARESAGTSAAIYLTIDNKGGSADRLTTVRSDRGEAGLHMTATENGIARMRPVAADEGLEIPAGGTLRLEPHGAHVMLTGLDRPLAQGERLSLTLEFRRSPPAEVTVRVVEAGATGYGRH